MTDIPVPWFSQWVWNKNVNHIQMFSITHTYALVTLHIIKLLFENISMFNNFCPFPLFFYLLFSYLVSFSVDHHRHKSNAPFYVFTGSRTFRTRHAIGRLLSGTGGVRRGSATRSTKKRTGSRPGERPQSPHLREITGSLYRCRHRSHAIFFFTFCGCFFPVHILCCYNDAKCLKGVIGCLIFTRWYDSL